jgi:serine/threonine protein phosphatase PrpC
MDTILRGPIGARDIALTCGYTDFEENPTEPPTMAGSTSVVCVIRDSVIWVANAGDSRCVLARGGKAIDMSNDHKPDNEHELARITKAGGIVMDGRINGNINLSRSIGDLSYKENADLIFEEQTVTAFPDVKQIDLTPEDDFIILACDGIWDVMSSQECVDFVYERIKQTPIEKIVEDICDHCLSVDVHVSEGIGGDNMTVIVVAFK